MYHKHHCAPTSVMPAVVHPTKCCVKHTFNNVIVPEIHPTHTTNVNHTNVKHVNYFPHTESFVNEVTSQSVNAPGPGPMGLSPAGMGPGAGPGFGPGGPGGPMGVGPMGVGPAGMGPGFGPGPGPGCCGPRPGFPY